MVLLELVLMARTEFVKEISMPKHGEWHSIIKCGSCNTTFPKEVTFSLSDRIEVVKETVNFQAKCKECDRKGTITISDKSTYSVRPDEDGNVKGSIAVMDCRGLEVLEVKLGNSLTVTVAGSGTDYENADFTDLWAEYDEKSSNLAQVENPKIVINRLK